jgi:hypothetical protein
MEVGGEIVDHDTDRYGGVDTGRYRHRLRHLLWLRLLLTGEPLTNDLADRVAQLVTTGAIEPRARS